MALRIAIFNGLRDSILLVKQHLRMLLLLFWFPVLVEFLWLIALRLDWVLYVPERVAGFFYIVPEIILAPAFVAAYRLFVTGQAPVFRKCELRRDPGRDPWLTIKFYFRYGRVECLYALLNIVVLCFHREMSSTIGVTLVRQAYESGLTFDELPFYHPLHSYVYMLSLSIAVVTSALILWWPYIATAAKVEGKNLLLLVKAMWGNIFRVFLVTLLIFLPILIFDQIWPWVSFLDAHFGWEDGPLYMIGSELSRLVLLVSMVVDVAFASLLWKSALNPLKSQGK